MDTAGWGLAAGTAVPQGAVRELPNLPFLSCASTPSQNVPCTLLEHFCRNGPSFLGEGSVLRIVAVASALARWSWLRLRMSSFCSPLGTQHACHLLRANWSDASILRF
jgi:hypothetical protein